MLHLRRITSGASWIPQIDGLRFMAILAVVLFHIRGEVTSRGLAPVAVPQSAHWFDFAVLNGDRGVPLFFVISGLILGRPFLRQHRLEGRRVSLGGYLLRRLTRLELPFALSLLIYTVAAMAAFHIAFGNLRPHLLASTFYLHSLIYARPSEISFVTWSLEVEVQFYLLAPLLGSFYRIPNTAMRRGVLAVLALAWGAVVWRTASFGELGLRFGLLTYLQYFLTGLLLADLLEFPRFTHRESWLWDAVSVLCWPAIFLLPRTDAVVGFLPLLIAPAYLAAFRGRASNWFFRQPVIALTGGMCYSIYLLHMLLISVSFRAIKHVQFAGVGSTLLVQGLLLSAVVFALSPVYFVLVERPCMDPHWPGKLAARLRGLGRSVPDAVRPSM